MRQVKDDLLSPLGLPFNSNRMYHEWLHQHKEKIIFKYSFEQGNLLYDVKADPLGYLYGMVHVCSALEEFHSYHQAIPLRTSMSPRYMTMDTAALIDVMMEKGQSYITINSYSFDHS